MVTKPKPTVYKWWNSSVLAKILMVTKHARLFSVDLICSVLAKILMVTKRYTVPNHTTQRSVLAKILMVTKHSV